MEQQIMFSRLVVLVAAGVSLAAAADVRVVEEIAVKCNGDIITRGELEEQRRELELYLRQEQHLSGPQLQTAVEEQSKDMLREKIDELLLVQKAKDLNISVESDVNRRLGQMQVQSKITDPDKFHDYIREQSGIPFEDFRQKLVNSFLTNRVIGQEVGSHVVIPEPELRQYYEQHKAEYMRQEQVFLSQIFISTEGKTPEQIAAAEAKAKDLVARARKGEKFADLAASNSDDTETARNGGQLPPRGRGMSLKEIDDFAFKQKKGSVTDPIPTKNPAGFAIVRIDERFEAGQAPFEEVKEQIQDKMQEPRMAPKVREFLTKLRQQAFLEVKDGYVDTGAAPGKDTRWHDVAQLKPQTTTKEEVLAHKKRKKFLGVIPHGGKTKTADIDTSTLGAPKDPAAAPATAKDPTTPPATAPIKQ
jgi:peptidyl-prolyl cis-trans isomerase SurA